MVAEALKQSNNNPDRSYHLLTAEPDLLRLAVNNSKPPYIPIEADILEIMNMGFTRPQAYGTLKLTRGDLTAAVEKLLAGQGVEENPLLFPLFPAVFPTTDPLAPLSDQPLNNPIDPMNIIDPINPVIPAESPEEIAKKEKEQKLLQNAEYELIGDHDEDPLIAYDIDLTHEAQFIGQYLSLINSSY